MTTSPFQSTKHILSSDRWRWWLMVRQDNSNISKHLAWDSSLQMLEHVRTTKQMWRCDMHWNADVQLSYLVIVLVGEAEILQPSWRCSKPPRRRPFFVCEWRFFLPGRAVHATKMKAKIEGRLSHVFGCFEVAAIGVRPSARAMLLANLCCIHSEGRTTG